MEAEHHDFNQINRRNSLPVNDKQVFKVGVQVRVHDEHVLAQLLYATVLLQRCFRKVAASPQGESFNSNRL